MTNDNQPTNTPGRSSALLPGVLLIVVLLMGLLMLMALGFKESPMLSAAFVIVLLTVVIGGAIAWVRDSRGRGRAHSEQLSTVHTTVAQASAQAFAATTTALFEYLKQNQIAPPTVTTYLPPSRVPELPAATSIPRIRVNGKPIGVKLQTIAENGDLLTCSPEGLEAALKILADGEQPTRENFKRKGIYSSTEIAGVVDWLAGQGQTVKGGQGAITKWADGVTPASAPTLADEYRVFCPSLPYFISQSFADESLTGAGQVGQQAGKRGAR